jgi:hypothetical protein
VKVRDTLEKLPGFHCLCNMFQIIPPLCLAFLDFIYLYDYIIHLYDYRVKLIINYVTNIIVYVIILIYNRLRGGHNHDEMLFIKAYGNT